MCVCVCVRSVLSKIQSHFTRKTHTHWERDRMRGIERHGLSQVYLSVNTHTHNKTGLCISMYFCLLYRLVVLRISLACSLAHSLSLSVYVFIHNSILDVDHKTLCEIFLCLYRIWLEFVFFSPDGHSFHHQLRVIFIYWKHACCLCVRVYCVFQREYIDNMCFRSYSFVLIASLASYNCASISFGIFLLFLILFHFFNRKSRTR